MLLATMDISARAISLATRPRPGHLGHQYILRLELLKLGGIWDRYPAVADWWGRVRARQSVKTAIFDRMTEADAAPFKISRPIPGSRCRNC